METLPAEPFPDELPQGHDRRKCWLLLHHPQGSPPALPGEPDYLLHPPSRLAPTAAWISYRDVTLSQMITERPGDPGLPDCLAQAEKVLAFRSAVLPADRFWRPDAPFYRREVSGCFRRRLLYPAGSPDRARCMNEARRFVRLCREETSPGKTAQNRI